MRGQSEVGTVLCCSPGQVQRTLDLFDSFAFFGFADLRIDLTIYTRGNAIRSD